jgi:hypothetical protein
MNSKYSSVLFLILTLLAACSKKDNETRVVPDEIAASFKNLTLPLERNYDVPVDYVKTPLDSTVAKFFQIDADSVFPVGKIKLDSASAFINYVKWNEIEESVVVTFFNNKEVTEQLIISGTTYEVPDHFAIVEEAKWNGSTITRSIEYHSGQDGVSSHQEVITSVSPDGKLVSTPESIIPVGANALPRPVEIITYFSQENSGLVITGIYPHEDVPVFLVSGREIIDNLHVLRMDTGKETSFGVALEGDENFKAIHMTDEAEKSTGVNYFQTITLVNKQDKKIAFSEVAIKRAPFTPALKYAYDSDGGASGRIELTMVDPITATFSSDISSGEPDNHICQGTGAISIRYNVGYHEGNNGEEACKLVFAFSDKKLQILQLSSNGVCGCGANASYDGEYQKQ